MPSNLLSDCHNQTQKQELREVRNDNEWREKNIESETHHISHTSTCMKGKKCV